MQQQLMALEPSTWLSGGVQERRRPRAQRRVALPSCQFCRAQHAMAVTASFFLIASVCFLICARTLKDDFVAELEDSAQVAPDSVRVSRGQKKTEVALCLFNRASRASRPIRLASGGIPSPSVGSELLLVPALRYAFLLSTLPPVSHSLTSAVGRASVPVSVGNITKTKKTVNTFSQKKLKKVSPDQI